MSVVNAPSVHLPTLPSVRIDCANGHGTHSAKADKPSNHLSNGCRETAPRPSVRSESKEFDTKLEKKGKAIVTMSLVSEAAYSRTAKFFEGNAGQGEGTPESGPTCYDPFYQNFCE